MGISVLRVEFVNELPSVNQIAEQIFLTTGQIELPSSSKAEHSVNRPINPDGCYYFDSEGYLRVTLWVIADKEKNIIECWKEIDFDDNWQPNGLRLSLFEKALVQLGGRCLDLDEYE